MARRPFKKGRITGNPSLSNDNATDSICPYGWQLVGYEWDKSLKKLIADIYRFIDTSGTYSKIDGKDQYRSDITLLAFLRSGYYYYNGRLYDQGAGGRYWSLHGISSTSANYLYAVSARIVPQNSFDRGYGLSLRCLAR